MKLKIIIGLILCSISLISFAQNEQSLAFKVDGNINLPQENLIKGAFLYLNKFWSDKGESLSREMTEKYFEPDTSLIINGRTVYTGIDQFDAHFKAVSKNIRGKIRFPLREVLSVKNKLIVYFDEDIYDNHGNYYPSNVIAIFTLHNNKIQRWEEVVNSKFFCQAESTNIVYSK